MVSPFLPLVSLLFPALAGGTDFVTGPRTPGLRTGPWPEQRNQSQGLPGDASFATADTFFHAGDVGLIASDAFHLHGDALRVHRDASELAPDPVRGRRDAYYPSSAGLLQYEKIFRSGMNCDFETDSCVWGIVPNRTRRKVRNLNQ